MNVVFLYEGSTVHYLHYGDGNVSTKTPTPRCSIHGVGMGYWSNGHTSISILDQVLAVYPAGNISSKYLGFLVYMVSNWTGCEIHGTI